MRSELDTSDPELALAEPGDISPADALSLHHLETATRYLYTNLLPLPLIIVAMIALLSRWQPLDRLAVWGGMTLFTWSITLFIMRRFLHDETRRRHLLSWQILIGLALFISTLALSSLSPLFWAEGVRLNNVLLYTFLAAGIASAGAQSAPSIPISASNLVPYSAAFLYVSLRHESWPMNFGIAAIQLCYIGLVLAYVKTVWQLSHEAIVLRDEKRALITRLQAALNDAVRAQSRAETASRAKSEFLANMSHELRTPLNAVLGFSEVIRDRVFGPDALPRYSEYAGFIHASGSHLLGLVNDVLDLAKIESGKLTLNESELDLLQLGEEVLALLKPVAERKGVALALDLPQPLFIRADDRAMRQILVNLLSNAVKFSHAGGEVSVRMAREADGNVVIAVKDEGVGIAEEDLSRVLQSFAQGRHDVKTTEEGGTGLGLAIVKGLAEAHGGSVALESEVGRGTTALLRLPASRFVRSGSEIAA